MLYFFLDESYRVNSEVHSMSLLAARVSARRDCCSVLHLLSLGTVEVGDQDARALLSKELGSSSTQALSRARDDGHLYHNRRPTLVRTILPLLRFTVHFNSPRCTRRSSQVPQFGLEKSCTWPSSKR